MESGAAARASGEASVSGSSTTHRSPWGIIADYFLRGRGGNSTGTTPTGRGSTEANGVQGAVFAKAVNSAREAEKMRQALGFMRSGSSTTRTGANTVYQEQGPSQESAEAEDSIPDTDADDIPERLKYFLDNRKIAFLRKQFHLYDTDGSGTISTSELQVFLKDSLGVVIEERKLLRIIDSVTPEHAGTLTFGAFVLVWYQYCSEKDSKDKIIQMAFEYLDQDGSESISLDNFTSVMTAVGGDPLTDEECKLFYQLLDKGKSQELLEDEFKQFMRNHLDQEPSQNGGPLVSTAGPDMMMFQTLFKRAVSVLMR